MTAPIDIAKILRYIEGMVARRTTLVTPRTRMNGGSALTVNGDGEHAESDQASSLVASLGELVRQARAGRYSIEDLAARSGVSVGRISEIERGLANPSFTTMWKLASALERPLGAFFDGASSNNPKVVRRDERKKLVLPHDDLVYELLTPNLQGRLEVFLFHVPAGFDNSQGAIRHSGEELIHLLSGGLEVTVGSETFELQEGDSITYDADLPHFVRNTSSRKAVAIAAITPPSF